MEFEETLHIDVPAKKLFEIYQDVDNWSKWDPEITSSSLNGEFATGTTGTLKPVSGFESKIVLTEVVPDSSFTVQLKLPLCIAKFEHELKSNGTGTEVLHRVKFEGLLSPLFGRLIGGQIRKGFPRTLAGMKREAEKN